MLRSLSVFLSAIVVLAPLLADPVEAQTPRRKTAAVTTPPPPVSDANALAGWCNQVVFRKYGKPGPQYGPKFIEMPLEQQARMQDACIRSKGQIY